MISAIWDKGPQYIAAFATLWSALYATGTLEDLGLVDAELPEISRPMHVDGSEAPAVLFAIGPEPPADPVTIVGGIIVSVVLAFFAYMVVRWLRSR